MFSEPLTSMNLFCLVFSRVVPDWLSGCLYLNGPGLYHIGEDSFNHVFDGMAVLHKFTIKNGHVDYCNRLVQSKTFKRNKEANQIIVSEFCTLGKPDQRRSFLTRYFYYIYDQATKITDNTCISLLPLNGKLFALTETTGMNEIDPVSLKTLRHVDLWKYIKVWLATAHPLMDADGTLWNFGTSFSFASQYHVMKIPKNGKKDDPFSGLQQVCKIPAKWGLEPSYYHSFGMSENYMVLVEQCLTVPLLSVATAPFKGLSVFDALKYYPNEKCIFHVVNKKTEQLVNVKYVANSFFVMHHANTFEDDGHLVIDLSSYPDNSILTYMNPESPMNGKKRTNKIQMGTLWRFVLPLSTEKLKSGSNANMVSLDYTTATAVRQSDGSILCTPQVFSDCVFEMPQTSPLVACKKYRYIYGVKGDEFDPFLSTELMKYDILMNKVTIWSDDRFTAEEPIFVPHPKSESEDNGLILASLVSKSNELPSALLILNAETFTEIGRADIPTHIKVPFKFHGFFHDFN